MATKGLAKSNEVFWQLLSGSQLDLVLAHQTTENGRKTAGTEIEMASV
jgi:hypothetical protein